MNTTSDRTSSSRSRLPGSSADRPAQPRPLWEEHGGQATPKQKQWLGARLYASFLSRQAIFVSGLVLVLVLIGSWWTGQTPSEPPRTSSASGLTSPASTAASSPQRPSRVPLEQSNTATASPSAIPSKGGSALPPAQVAQTFLGAYFTWTSGETDEHYVGSWKPWAASNALALLIKNAPRLLMDGGADAASSGLAIRVDATRLQPGSGQVQLNVTWVLQVLPSGGELAAWQPRQVQASVALLQSADQGWQVAGLTWVSSVGGGN